MGYFQYRMKCKECGREWNSFFCSVDMSSGANNCTCGGNGERIADEWKMDDGKWLGDLYKDKK